jgi:hypothetical protein
MTHPEFHPLDRPAGPVHDHPAAIAADGADARLVRWPEDRLNLVVLFLLAWVLRAGLVAWGGLDWMGESDGEGYYSAAVGLVEGRGIVRILPNGRPHLSAFHMPLTELLLAGGMTVFGTTATVARLVAISFGSLAAPLMYLVAGTIMPRRWAGIAGLACALHPVFLFYSIQTVTQPFYIPLLLLAVLLVIRALRKPGLATAFAAGITWGLAALCRPLAAPAAVLLALGMAWTLKSWRPALGLALGMALVMSPWWARNYAVFGRPVLLCLEGGETFLGANNPYVVADPELAGMWLAPMSIPEYRDRMIQCEDEIEINETLMGIGKDYLRGHPRVIPRLVLNKWIRWLTPITKAGGMIRMVVLSTYGSLLAMVALGAVFGAIRPSPLLIATLAVTLADVVTVGIYWGNLTVGRIDLELIWLPWGVQAFRMLVAAPLGTWSGRWTDGE